MAARAAGTSGSNSDGRHVEHCMYELKLSSCLGELGLAARACPFMVALPDTKAEEEKICVVLMLMRGHLDSTTFWGKVESAAAGSSCVGSLRRTACMEITLDKTILA